MTKDGVAQAFGLKMIKDEASENKLNTFFKSIHRDITINNYRQAYFPEGSIILKNDRGTAPGCILEQDETTVIVLSRRLARELNHMFLNEAKPYLLKKSGFIIKSNLLKVFGIGESELEHRLLDLSKIRTIPLLRLMLQREKFRFVSQLKQNRLKRQTSC